MAVRVYVTHLAEPLDESPQAQENQHPPSQSLSPGFPLWGDREVPDQGACSPQNQYSHMSQAEPESHQRDLSAATAVIDQIGNGQQMVRPQTVLQTIQKGEDYPHNRYKPTL